MASVIDNGLIRDKAGSNKANSSLKHETSVQEPSDGSDSEEALARVLRHHKKIIVINVPSSVSASEGGREAFDEQGQGRLGVNAAQPLSANHHLSPNRLTLCKGLCKCAVVFSFKAISALDRKLACSQTLAHCT